MQQKLSIADLDLHGRTVFIRADFNVPLDQNLLITDDTRIRASLPSLEHAVKNGARIILASHLGRPKGQFIGSMSLKPVAERLGRLLDARITLAPDCVGEEVRSLADSLENGDILLLENLRFHAGETENDPQFAKYLATPADVYVNDAFGTAHRAHASTVGMTVHFAQRAAGFLLDKEIEYFDNKLSDPQRPYIALLGGAKVSGKIPVIKNLITKVDKLLIGGAMAFTFFKALDLEIGKSLVEIDLVERAAEFMKNADAMGKEILLPHDLKVADKFSDDAKTEIVPADSIPADWMGLDIGPQTVETWKSVINCAKTIVWNGPMGAFEMPSFSNGTVQIARAIAESGVLTVVGGGDSVAALEVAGVTEMISHVSTGGGASLDFLAGKELPAISALTDKE